MSLTDVVGWVSLAAGIATLIAAFVSTRGLESEAKAARSALKDAAEKSQEITAKDAEEGKFEKQAGPLSTALEAVAKLATALKDLDRVGQLLTVSLGFFTIAAVAAGLESIAQALAGGG